MRKIAIIIAVALTTSAAYAHNEVVLELIAEDEVIEGHKKGETCLYRSVNTDEEWWYHKKDIAGPDGKCPFVIRANEL